MFISQQEAEKIIETHYEEIYRYCCAVIGNSNDASDVTQDVILLFLQKRSTLSASNIRAWLYKTASNKMHEYFRNKKKEQHILPLEEIADTPDTSYCENISADESDIDSAQRKILSILTDKEKELYFQLYIDKQKVSTIASEKGVSEGAIYTQKSRLRNKILNAVQNLGLSGIIVFIATHIVKGANYN